MVVEWLNKAVIPFIITSDPEAVTGIIQWLDDQIGALELHEKETSLDDAICLSRSVLKSLERVCDVDLQDKMMTCELALSPLKEFKTKYKCLLSLETFRTVLLSRASDSQYKWEDRITTLIKVISDPKEKITTLLIILDNVMQPVPHFIEEIVTEMINPIQHPLVAVLKEKWNTKEADNIVSLYGFSPEDVKSTYFARMAAEYDIAIEDDVQLPKFRCKNFIEKNEICRDTQLLKASVNLIENYVKCSSSSSSKIICQEFHQVLSQVYTMFSQLENKEKAMLWCHFIVNMLQHVGEKAGALQYCISYAEMCLNSAQELHLKIEATTVVMQFKRMLQEVSTLWSLCQAGLDKDIKFTELIRKPEDLIQQLYTHPCIMESLKEQRDINKLCEDIADQHGTNLLDIRKALLDKWLLGTSSIDADQMAFDLFPQDDYNMPNKLERALYVMKSRDRLELLEHVTFIANLDGDREVRHKTALSCVLKIATGEEFAHLLMGEKLKK